MSTTLYAFLCAALLTGFAGAVFAADPGAAPPVTSSQPWTPATPEEVGIDSTLLIEMLDYAREGQISVHSIQLVRHGRMVLDAYFYPYDGRTRHDVASVTKSITSTLVGLTIERGKSAMCSSPSSASFLDAPSPGATSESAGKRSNICS